MIITDNSVWLTVDHHREPVMVVVLVRQSGAFTMATNPVHAHARPVLISLSALPGLTFIYQHLFVSI